MKTNRFKTLWSIALGLVLLATALPFLVQAQSGAKTNGSQEITLTIEGSILGGRFFFKENTIQFDTLNKYEWPQEDFSVNGKTWSELNKPFELDSTPDFAKAVILEKEGGPEGRTYVIPRENLFALMIVPDDADSKPAPFRVKLAVKNQVQHDNLPPDETPAGENAENVRYSHSTRNSGASAYQENASEDSSRTVQLGSGNDQIPGRIYPREYNSRMDKMKRNSEEKNRRRTLMMRFHGNPSSFDDEQKKEIQKWMNEGNYLTMMREDTTDGKEIPVNGVGGGLGIPRFQDLSATHVSIEIEAVIDYVAEFYIQDNKITYNYLSTHDTGKFPRQVKINGKPWKNLYVPFDLGMSLDPLSIQETLIETELYRYYILPEIGGKTNISIDNHGFREEPVKIKLSIRKR